jgi:hypothetical protein
MYVPNPYTDPTFAAQMALTFPFYAYSMLPAYAVLSANAIRAASLPAISAATAWNIAVLSVLAGQEVGGRPAGATAEQTRTRAAAG